MFEKVERRVALYFVFACFFSFVLFSFLFCFVCLFFAF